MRIVLDLQGAQSESRFRGIGRYSLALAQAIAREAGKHEIWLALSGRYPDSIESLRTAFADLIPPERVRVFELPGLVSELDLANSWRMQAAELLRENFLAALSPDIVHVSTLFEGLGNEVVASIGRLSTRVPTAVTLYDLIPILHSDGEFGEANRKRHSFRRAQSLKRADLLLAISESSRREAVNTLYISPGRIANISAGVEPSFRRMELSVEEKKDLMARLGLQRNFVLYTGGLESRKNLEGLVAAFALLPSTLVAGYQVAITGTLTEEETRGVSNLSRKHRIPDNTLVCVGHVSDDDLKLLYNVCSLFVFPSLHEGFGLPALEAMACGAPVIGSDRTSIPEIIDRVDALFNPEQPESIADRMSRALANSEFRESLQRWGIERAKSFTWEASARKALSAFDMLHAESNTTSDSAFYTTKKRRPRLAFLSPLPPERTGIAGYAARLLPNLARHYEIFCVVDQPEITNPWITAEFPIHDINWFESNVGKFDRVLYHFGNSPAHKHMFDLIDRHPGVVILHDFFLSAALGWMEESGYAPGAFIKALYDSHGFSALNRDCSDGRPASIATFPCNAWVFQNSIGVIAHSHHTIELARNWYGDQVTTLMCPVPFLPFPPLAVEQAKARMRLGLPDDAFVACSFGWVAPSKLSHQLVEAWINSPLCDEKGCYLIFVGENHGGEYGTRLLERIAQTRTQSVIRITGYCGDPEYSDYLSAADVAIQLRTGSRGETSGAIFDCLSRGVPLVVNAHGSMAELPNKVVLKLRDEFAPSDLSAALLRVRTDAALRQRLSESGHAHTNQLHHPERVAAYYSDAIEELYDKSPKARELALADAIGCIEAPVKPSEADLDVVATSFAANRSTLGLRQIIIDVTHLAESDLRTGIERLARGILLGLIADSPRGYRVEPVRAVGENYHYARRFGCQCLGLDSSTLTDDPVELDSGDIFVGVDWCADILPFLRPWFSRQRARGVHMAFVVHDILPLRMPQYFPPEIAPMTLEWIKTVSSVAHRIVCNSRSTADDVYSWLNEVGPETQQPLSIQYFHLGADLHASAPTRGLPDDADQILARLRSRPSFLMVGTVEPRKGHLQVATAMEELWAQGIDTNLVMVGKRGWNIDLIDRLEERMRKEPFGSSRLFWLQGITDEMLVEVYRNVRALVAASEAEGFGLPLIEAAHYGLPIIARDIPVFREVAGKHAYYFDGKDPRSLAEALRNWLSLGNEVPSSAGISWLSWQQSSRELFDAVLGKNLYRFWPDSASDPRWKEVPRETKNDVGVAHAG
jgi:glycosyltransferase involved in cell wall biosynthesis